jgi:hypothetical protein
MIIVQAIPSCGVMTSMINGGHPTKHEMDEAFVLFMIGITKVHYVRKYDSMDKTYIYILFNHTIVHTKTCLER